MPGTAPAAPLRVLVVEDVEDDALLLAREIRRAGFEPAIERVETAEGLAEALDRAAWDVVIADHSLPRFSGMAALRIVRERAPDLPFVLVSGIIDEESAVAAMRAGAHDYVMKDNLRRLGPAVRRELHEAGVRRRRAEVERALEEERDYSRRLIDGASAMIVGLDGAGRITVFNRAAEAVTGISRSAVLGQSVFDVLIGRVAWPGEWCFGNGEAPAPAADAEIPLRTAAGADRLVAWRYAPLSGAGAGALLFGIDVSDRQKAEEEREAVELLARRSERLASLGTLAAGLAHELNNPLGIISSRIELMLLDDEGAKTLSPSVREDLVVLRRHAQRVGRLAQGLLSFARQGAAGYGPVHLNEVVRDVLLLTEPQIAKSGATVRTALDAHPSTVVGDGASLQQVVLNLVTNAWQALDGPGEIRVETRAAANGRVELVVADTGRGIPAADLERVFDPFFTTRRDGSGLGLAITHGIVRDHHGTIHAESTVGQGTRFVVSLRAAA